MCRYAMRVGDIEEHQVSSGVWVSTALGSTGAIRSAGGRVLPLQSKKFEYVVRELFREKGDRIHLTKGIISNGALEIQSRMKQGKLFMDGSNISCPVSFGERIRFSLSNEPPVVVLGINEARRKAFLPALRSRG